jgi:hypothetical protein
MSIIGLRSVSVQALKLQKLLDQGFELRLKEDIHEPVWSDGDFAMNDAWDSSNDLALEGPDFDCPHSSNKGSNCDILRQCDQFSSMVEAKQNHMWQT